MPCNKQIIIINDGSDDGTTGILQTMQEKYTFTLLQHTQNQGRGVALRTVLKHITGDITVIQDGDLEYDPADYPELIKPFIESNAKVVYGSRFIVKNKWQGYKINYFYNKTISAIIRTLTKLPITDAMSGYKFFKTHLLNEVTLYEKRFGIDIELVFRVAAKNKDSFTEVPINYYPRTYREGKKIGIKDALNMLIFLISNKKNDNH